MPRRLHSLVALVSIALVAIDAVVGVWGHTHAHEQDSREPKVAHHHVGGCSHHHHAPAKVPAQDSSQPGQSDSGPHDDCALCRHFSQPVSPSIIVIEIAACERVEACVPALCPRINVVIATIHTARGPPTLCA
jgi:hypothetical protein